MTRGAALLVCLAGSLALAPWAAAGPISPEQELADRYAPVVVLQRHEEPCGDGEPYRPAPVDVVLGNPEVVLRGPGDGERIVKRGPTARDLFGKGGDYFLDLPGNPLRPGCTYEKELDRWSAGRPVIAYAHVAGELNRARQLVLQYWLYYGFNDFNDKHESDWEMIQLVFGAANAIEALRAAPREIAYSQH